MKSSRLDEAPACGLRQRGVTLVEIAVAVALVVILLAVAVPSLTTVAARMRLEGATHGLSADLQLARAEAVQRRAAVNLTTQADGTVYTLTSGATTIKTVALPGGVTFTGGVTVTFEPLRGLANAATLTGSSASAGVGQLRLTSDAMGRVQMCSPSGQFKGYAAC